MHMVIGDSADGQQTCICTRDSRANVGRAAGGRQPIGGAGLFGFGIARNTCAAPGSPDSSEPNVLGRQQRECFSFILVVIIRTEFG